MIMMQPRAVVTTSKYDAASRYRVLVARGRPGGASDVGLAGTPGLSISRAGVNARAAPAHWQSRVSERLPRTTAATSSAMRVLMELGTQAFYY
jgi:hypothetical protein